MWGFRGLQAVGMRGCGVGRGRPIGAPDGGCRGLCGHHASDLYPLPLLEKRRAYRHRAGIDSRDSPLGQAINEDPRDAGPVRETREGDRGEPCAVVLGDVPGGREGVELDGQGLHCAALARAFAAFLPRAVVTLRLRSRKPSRRACFSSWWRDHARTCAAFRASTFD